jgi:hypothetical protein
MGSVLQQNTLFLLDFSLPPAIVTDRSDSTNQRRSNYAAEILCRSFAGGKKRERDETDDCDDPKQTKNTKRSKRSIPIATTARPSTTRKKPNIATTKQEPTTPITVEQEPAPTTLDQTPAPTTTPLVPRSSSLMGDTRL